MRVLLLETDPGAGEPAATELRHAGHTVERCHEPGLGPFPCTGISEHRCPLDERATPDVVVTYRAHPYARPTPFEDGVSCAIRHNVPVVVAGTSAQNPYAAWSAEVAGDDDIVAACEAAASGPLRTLSVTATSMARLVLDREGVPGDPTVVVRRTGGTLRAEIHLPEAAAHVAGTVAVRVAGALHQSDPYGWGSDVAVVIDPEVGT